MLSCIMHEIHETHLPQHFIYIFLLAHIAMLKQTTCISEVQFAILYTPEYKLFCVTVHDIVNQWPRRTYVNEDRRGLGRVRGDQPLQVTLYLQY